MKRDEFPDKDVVFDALALLFPILYTGYEDAVRVAKFYFLTAGREVNIDLFPCLVRDAFLLFLQKGCASGSFTIEFEVKPLSNNGVEVRYKGYVLRFRMTFDGMLAAPGKSRTLQAHYQQLSWEPSNLLFRQMELPFPLVATEYNLVVLWQVDRAHLFQGLFLAAPKDADELHVETYWIEPIPYLGNQAVQPASEPQVPDLDVSDDFVALNDESQDELGIEKPEDESGESGTG